MLTLSFSRGARHAIMSFVLNEDSLMPADMFLVAISVSYSLFTFGQHERPSEDHFTLFPNALYIVRECFPLFFALRDS